LEPHPLALQRVDHERKLVLLLALRQVLKEAQLQHQRQAVHLAQGRAELCLEQAQQRVPPGRGDVERGVVGHALAVHRLDQSLVAQQLEGGAHQVERWTDDAAGEMADLTGELAIAAIAFGKQAERGETQRLGSRAQTSASAATSLSMSSSLCCGDGVRRSRSSPRGTVG